MLRNLRDAWNYFNAMGWRYMVFRIWYEVTLRSGVLAMRFPVQPTLRKWIELDEWRASSPPFLIGDRSTFQVKPDRSELLQREAQRILGGEIQFFYGEWKQVENQWLKNFDTGFQYDPKIHWTRIPDFSATIGDIKYVWEPSRFLFLQTILRYDLAFDKDHSEWVFSKIENWIDQNPINCGPNYRCSQEISIRLFNWIYALYFYRNSTALTNRRFDKIIWSIYWQAKHVRSNIHFSLIAVRNNHAITETLALYVVGTLFPFFAESGEWKKRGKSWFEQEILFQVFPDGGYLQYSFNYQRVVAQLLTLGLALARIHNDPIMSPVLERAQQLVRLMLSCQDIESGQLPNYGANDGSLFFRWNDRPFSDYRPALDGLHKVLTGKGLYQNLSPEAWWGSVQLNNYNMRAVAISDGALTFPDAGLFVYRSKNMHAMIVCPQLKARPSQADHLHLDVWVNGKNILIDGGAYRYNTETKLKRYFFGSESHNTVMIAEYDQMRKGPRFIWLNWTKVVKAGWVDSRTFLAEILCFEQLGLVKHQRKIEFATNAIIVIEDKVSSKGKLPMRQLWHKPSGNAVDASAVGDTDEPLVVQSVDANYSPTYGQLSPCTQFEFVTTGHRIRTKLIFE